MLSCISRNIPAITTLQVLDPNGIPLTTVVGVLNVTREYAGVYTCVITSTFDDSTVKATSVVIVECKYPFYNKIYYSAYIEKMTCVIIESQS